MLEDPDLIAARAPRHGPGRSPRLPTRARQGHDARAAQAAAFLACAGMILAYALPGGAYDLVIRQEYGLVVWVLLATGLVLGLLPRTRPSRGAVLVAAALAAYAAWTGASLAWTQSAERTTAELVRVLDYLGLYLLLASVIDRRLWRAAASGLAAGAMIVCLLSVASRLLPSAFPPNVVGAVFHIDRLSYPFGYWNAVAAWGTMTIALGLGWSANDSWTARRALLLAAVPVAGTMTYLSYSRAGVAGAALAVAAVIALSRHRWTALAHALVASFGTAVVIAAIRAHSQIAHASGTSGAGSVTVALLFACALCLVAGWLLARFGSDRWRLPHRLGRLAGGAVAVAAVLAAAAFGPQLASKAWHEFRHPAAVGPTSNPTQRLTSLSGTRYNLWTVALDVFEAQPLTGTGAGTYEFDWNRHQRDSEFVLNAHSLWFETMAELGFPGLLAILALAAAALALTLRVRIHAARRASAAGATAAAASLLVYLMHASVDWMWQVTAVTVLALAGVAIASARFSRAQARLRWRVRLGLVLAAALFAWLQLPGLLGTLEVGRSQAAERAGQGATALAWARDAASAEPWAATPHEQQALVLEASRRLSAAAAQEREAIADEPTNYTHWLIMARIQAEQGLLSDALRDYARARSLRTMGEVFTLQPRGLLSAIQASRR
jgi:hypothetical protein